MKTRRCAPESLNTVSSRVSTCHLGLLHSGKNLNNESSLTEIKSHCFLVVAVPLEGPGRSWKGNHAPDVESVFPSSVLSFRGL